MFQEVASGAVTASSTSISQLLQFVTTVLSFVDSEITAARVPTDPRLMSFLAAVFTSIW